jgi:tRNA pseudouridine13 synthase
VGERIVRGDLEGAVRAYVSEPSEKESPDIIGARAAAADTEDYASVIGDVPKGMSFEKIMMEHLISHPGDHAGAIGAMPPNLQMMFVHAYQSYLFNLMLSERMSRGMPLDAPVPGDVVIPADSDGTPQHERPIIATEKNMDLVARQVRMGRAFVTITMFGSASSIPEGEMGDIERSVIEREGIRNEDFIVPDLPRCSSKGSRREILCPVRDLRYSADGDGYTVAFSLTKGNYATCLMREFMKSEMHSY